MSSIQEFNIITVGDTGVGKTAILNQYVYKIFNESTLSTTGITFSKKKIEMKDGKEINLKLIDTSGQEKYHSLGKTYFKNADGVFFVFSFDSHKSFDNVQAWIKSFNDNVNQNNTFPKLLLGNKDDLEEKVITQEEIDEFAKKNEIKFLSTSAKNHESVEKAFKEISEMIYDNYLKGDQKDSKQKKVKLMSNYKKNNCCAC